MKRALILLALLVSVDADARRRAVNVPSQRTITDDFRLGTHGWEAGFADYSPLSSFMELDAGLRTLPPELGVAGTGFMMIGHNRSDDLFMFLRKKVSGLRPNARYEVSYRIVLASNAGGDQCGGIGGHPGYSVFLKAGASTEKPDVQLVGDHYRMTVDIGQQSIGGTAATVAGDISTGSDQCMGDAPYQTIVREHRHPHSVTADEHGELWLLVGTDSGFEGRTRLYYQSISVTIKGNNP